MKKKRGGGGDINLELHLILAHETGFFCDLAF